MAVAKIAGKKNLHGLKVWKLNDKIIVPVLYNGRHIGHGKYFAASVDGELVLNSDGAPYHFREIGELVNA